MSDSTTVPVDENTAVKASEGAAAPTDADTPTSSPPVTAEANTGGSGEEAAPAADEPPADVERISKWPSRYRDAYRKLEEDKAAEVQAAQDERDAAQALLSAERDRLIAATLAANGYSPKLFEAARLEHADVLDADGLIDRDLLDEKIAATAKELGVAPRSRKPLPMPLAGTGSGGVRSTDAVQSAFGIS